MLPGKDLIIFDNSKMKYNNSCLLKANFFVLKTHRGVVLSGRDQNIVYIACIAYIAYTHTYTTLHYITLHFITLHYTALHYITLDYIHIYIHTHISIYIYVYT